MQTTRSEIWIWVAMPISYINNCYAMSTSNMYVFTKLLCHEQDVTQGWFLTGVKLVGIDISFSRKGCLAKAKKLSLLYYLSVAGGRIHAFPKDIGTKCNTNFFV